MPQPRKRPVGLAIFLCIAGAVGFISSFALTLDKLEVLQNPDAVLGCNFSLIVQCGENLSSWQGAVFGFPNPLIGIAGFTAVVAVGVGILAGARFARWFWLLFNVGVLGALVFVIWLVGQSIFVLGTLCPWCMAVWSVTIPMFWLVTLHNLRTGVIPSSPRTRRFGKAAYGWVPLITLASYLVIAVIAQIRLDVLSYL